MAESNQIESVRVAIAGVLDKLTEVGAYGTPLYEANLKFYGELEAILEEQRWSAVAPTPVLKPFTVPPPSAHKPAPTVDWDSPVSVRRYMDWLTHEGNLTALKNMIDRQERDNKATLEGRGSGGRPTMSRQHRATLAAAKRKMLDSTTHYERKRKASEKWTDRLEGLVTVVHMGAALIAAVPSR